MTAIKGFMPHGNRWRAFVSLDESTAKSVAEEASRRDVPVGIVLRDRVRKVPNEL